MKKTIFLLLSSLVIISLIFAACAKSASEPTPTPTPAPTPAPAPPKETKEVRFGLGTGASIEPQMVAWSEIINKYAGDYLPYNVKTRLVYTTSFIAGMKQLVNDELDLNYSAEGFIAYLTHGTLMFKDFGPRPVRVLAYGAEANVHIVTLDPNIKKFEDLKGKRVSAARPGAPTMLRLFQTCLAIHNMTEDDVKILEHIETQDGFRQLKEGVADVVFTFTNRPTPSLQELAAARQIYLIPMPPDKIDEVMAREEFRYQGEIPAGTYKGVDVDVHAIRNFSCVVTQTDTDEEMSYAMVKAIFEHLDELQKYHPLLKLWTVDTIVGGGVFTAAPLNGGTVKYLKEIGKWTPEFEAKQKAAVEKLK